MTSPWGGGYVTDVEYTNHYFVTQTPQLLALACLVSGIAVDPPWDAPALHCLELGCGRGMTACAIAAANPGWRVTAIDVTPAAIADARRLAAAAGLANIEFIEADLTGFAETPQAAALPQADVITSHGLWSWVGDPVRAGVVRLAAAKLRAGGIMHLSYNAMPGQQPLLALQRILRESGRRLAGRSDRQAAAGRAVVRDLAAAGAAHLTRHQVVGEMIGKLEELPLSYLAHEYMGADWRPEYHADVAAALAPARLDYATVARLEQCFLDLLLTPEQRAIHDRFDDPLLRELIVDTCINRTLRHDIYVRGATRLSEARRDEALGRVVLGLAVPPEAFRYVLKLPAGNAQLNEDTYRPMVQALAAGPRSIAELGALRGDGQRANLAEIAMVFAGTYQALVLGNPAAAPSPEAHRFNLAVRRRDTRIEALNDPAVLASARIGAGLPCRSVEMLLAARIGATGEVPDPAAYAADLLPGADADVCGQLAGILTHVLQERLPIWHNLGIV